LSARGDHEPNRNSSVSILETLPGLHRKDIVMRACASFLMMFAVIGMAAPALAQQNDCKSCRDFRQACLKAHSSSACNADYTICMNHCRKK
jgi:hypothetical protein